MFSAALCRGLIEAFAKMSNATPTSAFSAALCRGLIEAGSGCPRRRHEHGRFSAALCRGLIEAPTWSRRGATRPPRFPRLYAAASLKQVVVGPGHHESPRFPRLYAAASLKLGLERLEGAALAAFSAALCRGLIEAAPRRRSRRRTRWRFSAALCRGLIEAPTPTTRWLARTARFPRLYAAASLKLMTRASSLAEWHMFSAALCRGLIEAASQRPSRPTP